MTETTLLGDCIVSLCVCVSHSSFHVAATQNLGVSLNSFFFPFLLWTQTQDRKHLNVSQMHYDEWRCLCAHFLGEYRHTQHQMLQRNSWFPRVLTSSLIRSGSRRLELSSPRGVGSNCKPRLMTPPEGRVSHSKSFLSSNLHTSLPSIWHSDSRMGSYGSYITPNP